MRRVYTIVLDGLGAGELPDAACYGDAGSNTLGNLARAVGGLRLPNLGQLGLGCVTPILGVPPVGNPEGWHGRMRERSPGKDSVTGHWEMMGIHLERPFPVYPVGFPAEAIVEFERAIGRKVLGNRPASGTQIIAELGAEHLRTGSPIVYTSADSVFQIAAHEDAIPLEQLYAICETARRLLGGEHAVGRVIARPFAGRQGSFRRTEGRRDYPLAAPPNALDRMQRDGLRVHGIGKIAEFFAGRSIASSDATTNNADHMAALERAARVEAGDFVFANLEDFDMLYGHRNDCAGFARALCEFDAWLPRFFALMRDDELLLITSDHGNDPTTPSTDHSREHALLLAAIPGRRGGDLGERATFADLGATVLEVLGIQPPYAGESFLPLMLEGAPS
jgi:phosphopentomutase